MLTCAKMSELNIIICLYTPLVLNEQTLLQTSIFENRRKREKDRRRVIFVGMRECHHPMAIAAKLYKGSQKGQNTFFAVFCVHAFCGVVCMDECLDIKDNFSRPFSCYWWAVIGKNLKSR